MNKMNSNKSPSKSRQLQLPHIFRIIPEYVAEKHIRPLVWPMIVLALALNLYGSIPARDKKDQEYGILDFTDTEYSRETLNILGMKTEEESPNAWITLNQGHPDYRYADLKLAQIFSNAGKKNEATKYINELLKADPTNTEGIRLKQELK